jgi:hypothetical protein
MTEEARHAVRQADTLAAPAREVLNNPGLRAAFDRLQRQYLDAIRRTAPEERDAREAYYLRLHTLDDLATDLARVISGAEIVRHNFRNALRTEDKS